jgi:hypothetical protein
VYINRRLVSSFFTSEETISMSALVNSSSWLSSMARWSVLPKRWACVRSSSQAAARQ